VPQCSKWGRAKSKRRADARGLDAAVTTGTSFQVDASGYRDITFYLQSNGTTSGGTVILEEADFGPTDVPYTGTWSQIASVSASTFTGSAQLAYHVTAPTAFAFIRARIGSTITGGGTVTIVLRAN
jgi:hypothetical protein